MKKFVSIMLTVVMVMSLFCVSPLTTFAMKNASEGFVEVSSLDFESITSSTNGVINGTADVSGVEYSIRGTNGGSNGAVGKTEWVKYSDISGYDGLTNAKYGTYGIKLTRTGSASAMARMEDIFDISKALVGDIYRVSMDMYLADVTDTSDDADKPKIRYFLSKSGSSAASDVLASETSYGYNSTGCSVTVNKWISTGFTFKITKKMIDEGIAGLRIDSAGESPYAQTTFIDNVKVEKLSGANLTESDVNYTDSFEMYNHGTTGSVDDSDYLSSKVYRFGGDSDTNKVYIYNPSNSSSNGKVRTGEKSLVQKNRASTTTAVKFLDLFNAPLTEDNVGEKYDVSLWVYADKNDGGYKRIAGDSGETLQELTTISSKGTYFKVSLTGPNEQNYKYRSSGISSIETYVPWNTWTEIKTSIFISEDMVDNGSTEDQSNPLINSIRVDQNVSLSSHSSDDAVIAKTVYFDDLSVTQKLTGYDKRYRRQVPTEFEKTSNFTDGNLLYYDMDKATYMDGITLGPVGASTTLYDDLKKGAQWRKDAIDRIKEIRMGDMNIMVTDANGYPVTNAKIDVNMYEHEFRFGTAINSYINTASNDMFREKFSENFNTIVNTTNFKWVNLIKRPGDAQEELQTGIALGAKHIRGHMLFCEGGNDANNFPDFMYEEEVMNNKNLFLEYCEEHVKDVAERFKDFDIECYDVLNEILRHAVQSNQFGRDIWVSYYNFARKYLPEGSKLFYNENDGVLTEDYITLMDEFVELGVDFDGLGIQSHYDSDLYLPSQQVALYNKLSNRYGKELQVTEYSNNVANSALQGNYTRDTLIAAFAEPSMTAFVMWGFADGYATQDISVIYDSEWNLKPAGEVYQDLVYNKWWTKESGTTDATGKFNTRGYYGEYDITVTTEDGYTETIPAEHFKNSSGSNDITIALTDYENIRTENDLFSFVHSGKIQISGKVLLPQTNKNPDYLAEQASLILIDDSKNAKDPGRIMHIAQVPIKADGTYEIEFKADNLDYGELLVNGCYVLMNVDGELIEDNIATVGVIPDCVAFDITPNVSSGKLNVAIDFTNKLKRSGIDYSIYAAIYGEGNKLVSMSKVNKSSTGEATENISLSEITLNDDAKSGKILIWLNNGKMIPLTGAKGFDITK